MTFQKGQSGNPKGRPKGSRNKRTAMVEQIFDTVAEDLTNKVVDLAKGGHFAALRLCMDRICPPTKERPAQIDLPPIGRASDAVAAMARLIEAIADGDVSAGEAVQVAKVVKGYSETVSNADFEERLEKLERKSEQKEKKQ